MRHSRSGRLLAAATVLLSLLGSSVQACERWLARLVSAQGLVQVQLAGSEQWRVAVAGTTFCEDVSVRVGAAGSAALKLANDTVLRLAPASAVSIRQQPNAPTPSAHLIHGRGHFLSRTPRRFNVSTPYLNAAIDGTEFLLVASPAADELILFEGRVTADGTALVPGQSLRVAADGRRELRLAVRSREGLDWALYYPPLASADVPVLAQALARLAAGDAAGAAQLARTAAEQPAARAQARALQTVIALAQGTALRPNSSAPRL